MHCIGDGRLSCRRKTVSWLRGNSNVSEGYCKVGQLTVGLKTSSLVFLRFAGLVKLPHCPWARVSKREINNIAWSSVLRSIALDVCLDSGMGDHSQKSPHVSETAPTAFENYTKGRRQLCSSSKGIQCGDEAGAVSM
jgi:hypothetical protein